MTSKTIDMQYTPPTSDTIQTKPFPIRGESDCLFFVSLL